MIDQTQILDQIQLIDQTMGVPGAYMEQASEAMLKHANDYSYVFAMIANGYSAGFSKKPLD